MLEHARQRVRAGLIRRNGSFGAESFSARARNAHNRVVHRFFRKGAAAAAQLNKSKSQVP
jgi:hypothetical protein